LQLQEVVPECDLGADDAVVVDRGVVAAAEQVDVRAYRRLAGGVIRVSWGLTVGRLDARFTGWEPDDAGDRNSYDPAIAAVDGPYSAAWRRYRRLVAEVAHARRAMKEEADGLRTLLQRHNLHS